MKQINRRKTKLNKENEARRARTFTSKTKAPWLDFNRSPQSIYSQPKQDQLANLEIQRSRPEQVSIRKILT